MTKHNNLFDYATSELSQDAFLCWWLAWASPEYKLEHPDLHTLGLAFLRLLAEKSGIQLAQVMSVELKTQYKNIDILCVVNQAIVFLIEDKTDTKEHGDQLSRYKEILLKDDYFKAMQIAPVFIKTGDQSNYDKVVANGYSVLTRPNLLKVLRTHPKALVCSDTAKDFTSYLQKVEDSFQSYASQSVGEWSGGAWRGFYCRLQAELGDGSWGKVNNPSGGFWGVWWHFKTISHDELYLQIEEKSLVIKVRLDNAKNAKTQGESYCNLLRESSISSELAIERPSRLRSGSTMTIAKISKSFPVITKTGTVDISKSIGLLRLAEKLIVDFLKAQKPKE